MNKEVLISLKGGQSDGDEREEIELVTKGKFTKRRQILCYIQGNRGYGFGRYNHNP